MANRSVLNEISEHIDNLVMLCQTTDEQDPLHQVCFRFQMEHASAKAEYSLNSPPRSQGSAANVSSTNEEKAAHMKAAMMRMADFALTAAKSVLERMRQSKRGFIGSARAYADTDSSQSGDSRERVVNKSNSHSEQEAPVSQPIIALVESPVSPVHEVRSGSVDSMHDGSEPWIEIGASVTDAAIQVLSLLLVADTEIRVDLQQYLNDLAITSYLKDVFSLSREIELSCFAEGYRTIHMTLLANLVYQNPSLSKDVLQIEALVSQLMNSRSIDEENPGLGEWAEFALRNICVSFPEGREVLKQFRKKLSTQADSKGNSPIPF